MQAKLLRVLQENSFVRIGGRRVIDVDIQIIVATNLDLRKEVEEGRFREDLYYRLNVVHIKVPPLRERKEDIPLLIDSFIENNKHKTTIRSIDNEAMKIFCNYLWPGNVRQLHNILERMMIFAEGQVITTEMLPKRMFGVGDGFAYEVPDSGEIDDLRTANVKYVYEVYHRLNGNISRTASTLNVSRATVYRMLKKEMPV
jgi:transcriptional regulator with PAS, ATPase and Fis domain